MNIMKKKPELLKRSGKSNLAIRNFLNNLKENDLHYENKQITQCVFLGVLRLKPVPSIFSHNVPSVSSTVESNRSRKNKATSNKEVNKPVSKKNNINKVLTGIVSKKNPDKIKAAVKKVPNKKSNLKTKKYNEHQTEPSISKNKHETMPLDEFKTTNPDPIIARARLLNPMISPTKFNPVQNLFDKLKKRIDESHTEPGPSNISSPNEHFPAGTVVQLSVCKMNANAQSALNASNDKKLKKSTQRKSCEKLIPLQSISPITISDTESTGKKDNDVILLDDCNSNNSNSNNFNDKETEEDVIIINDVRPKSKERISPRHKTTPSKRASNENGSIKELACKRNVIDITEEDKSSKAKNVDSVIITENEHVDITQPQEIIDISDDRTANSPINDGSVKQGQNHLTNKSDNYITIVDEVKEVRTSPRLRKEEKGKYIDRNSKMTTAGEVVIVTTEEKISNMKNISQKHFEENSVVVSKTQQLNISVDNQQNYNNNQTSPRLLKMINPSKKNSSNIKEESIQPEVTVVEKPKKRNSRTPALLPPMLLNAPMLLRSELSSKKPNYKIVEKPKVRKARDKMRDTSNLSSVKSHKGQTTKISKPSSIKPLEANSNPQPNETLIPCKETGNKEITTHIVDVDNIVSSRVSSSSSTKSKNVNESITLNNDIVILDGEEAEPRATPQTRKINSTEIVPQKIDVPSNISELEDVIVIKDEIKSKPRISPRLSKQKQSEKLEEKSIASWKDIGTEESKNVQISTNKQLDKINDCIDLADQCVPNRLVSPRRLGSNLNEENGDTSQTTLNKSTISVIEVSPKQRKSRGKSVQDINHRNLEETSNINETTKKSKNKSNVRLLRSDMAHLKTEELLVKTEAQVVVIHDKPKQNPSVSPKAEEIIVQSQEKQKKREMVRNLRTNSPLKVHPEVTPNNMVNSDIMKVESCNQELEETPQDIQKSPKNKPKLSRRLLRSAISPEAKSMDISNITSPPRLLRSDLSLNKNPQQCVTQQSSSPRKTERKKSLQKSPQIIQPETSSEIEAIQDKNSQNLEKDIHSPKTTERRKPPKRSLQAHFSEERSDEHLQENSNWIVAHVENERLSNKTLHERPNTKENSKKEKSISPKSSKTVVNKKSDLLATSKKVIDTKKKERKLNRRAKSILLNSKTGSKTAMLLRSELATLKDIAAVNQKENRSSKNNTKLKSENNLETENSNFGQKKIKSSKSRINSEIAKRVLTSSDCLELNIDNNNEVVLSDKLVPKVQTSQVKINKEQVDKSQSLENLIKSENQSIKKKSPRKPRTAKISPKRNLPRNKRSVKPTESVEEQKTVKDPIITKSEISDSSTKKIDVTVFDFEDTETEVPPLRLSLTPRKDKSMDKTRQESNLAEGNSTPTRKQKITDVLVAKVQAKAKLITVFDETSIQTNKDIPSTREKDSLKKNKSVSKRKGTKTQILEQQIPPLENENSKTKKDKILPSPKNNNSPTKQNHETGNSASRSSTSPLKQQTITDMFNKVMLKKETSSADSVFDSVSKKTPSKPQKESTGENPKSDMPPPSRDKKLPPPTYNQTEEDDPYDDDSDCESRMEWIPEEYAEYKFKYSAKKMMTYKPIHKCKICLLILPSYYKLDKHKKEHTKTENPYNCKQCEKAFSNIEDLTAHLRIHKGKHPYTCRKCDIGFWSKKALDAHTPIHVLTKVKQPDKRFRCDVCAKEFSKLCDMERHTRVHTGEKPCVCNICNKRFQQSHNLSKHLLTHLHVKPFHCEICNKQFGRNDVLSRHLLTHSVDKPIKCPLCSKGFIRQTQLNNHMKKNHLDAAKISTTPTNETKVALAK